jgi:molecular chaperone GrpE
LDRPRPDEGAVREQMKAEGEEVAGDESTASEGAGRGAQGAEGDAPDADGPATRDPRPATSEEDPLAEAQRERDEYLDLARRTQADFENYRKRSAKDIQAAGVRARSGLIRELLPVVDNLERALASAPEDADGAFLEGVRLVYMDLQGVLQRAGVEAIEPTGERFDPNVHEALSMRSEDGAESGVVLDVVEKGYRTADAVIRPARVVVAG